MIIQYYMEEGDYNTVIETSKNYGEKDPNIWIQILSYFCECHPPPIDHIKTVLDYIERKSLLPPLLVIQILGKRDDIPLSIVKDYVINRLKMERKVVEEDYVEIEQLQSDTAKMKQEIDDLSTKARIFQYTKCSGCGLPLDLPAVHFLCMHSYHQHCLTDNSAECPKCSIHQKYFLHFIIDKFKKHVKKFYKNFHKEIIYIQN